MSLQKWEFCELQLVGELGKRWAWQVILCEPDGKDTVIVRTSGWEGLGGNANQQRRQAIAQAGLDGWQLVPIGDGPQFLQRSLD